MDEWSMPPPRRIGTWQEAERNAAEWMRAWGYTDAVSLPGGPDKGIDVRAARAVAQVKWRSGAVGRPALQQLAGAADRGTQLLFFAASNYTRAALEFAGQRDIALFVYGPWGEMEPVNPAARQVAMQRPTTWSAPQGTNMTRYPPPDMAEILDAANVMRIHVARNWAAYLGGIFLFVPIVSITGTLWLDILILIGCWLIAALFLKVQLSRRRKRRPASDAQW